MSQQACERRYVRTVSARLIGRHGLRGWMLRYTVCLPFATLRCGLAEWNWVGAMHRCDGYVGV